MDAKIEVASKNVQLNERTSVYIKLKRIADFVFSLFMIIILSPVILLLCCLIKLDSSGSVIFKHNRIGKNGKIIKVYKFRTMVENADDLIKNFTEEQLAEWKSKYKLSDDPRVTKIGKFLRKSSLDELPQLFNILKGDMSLIGPRPILQSELDEYVEDKEKYLSVLPGLTGNWAVNGRSDTTYEERVEMEMFYIDNVSIALDTKIFFQTIITVIKREGAM